MLDTFPIYVYTFYLQRVPLPDHDVGNPDEDVQNFGNGYRILPGCTVEVFFYNTADAKYNPANDYRTYHNELGAGANKTHTEKMFFWQPTELMSHKVRSFFERGAGTKGTAAMLTDDIAGHLLSRNDIIKIRFVNDNHMPADADGNPSPCGVFANTTEDGDEWELHMIAGL